MKKTCVIKGKVLKFLTSYLTERKQKVVIGDSESRLRKKNMECLKDQY